MTNLERNIISMLKKLKTDINKSLIKEIPEVDFEIKYKNFIGIGANLRNSKNLKLFSYVKRINLEDMTINPNPNGEGSVDEIVQEILNYEIQFEKYATSLSQFYSQFKPFKKIPQRSSLVLNINALNRKENYFIRNSKKENLNNKAITTQIGIILDFDEQYCIFEPKIIFKNIPNLSEIYKQEEITKNAINEVIKEFPETFYQFKDVKIDRKEYSIFSN